MESVVSLFVFTLLMVAVTAMIQASLKMTGIFTEEANAAQKEINLVVLPDSGGVTANITLEAAAIGVKVEDTVIVHKSGEVLAFAPTVDYP